MRASIRRVGRALAITGLLLNLGACSPPQGAANAGQVMAGVNKPDAKFAVEFVNRDTLPLVTRWPDSHPAANRQWISHTQASPDPLIKPGDKLTLAVWDNDDSSLLSSPGQKVIPLPDLRVSSSGTIFMPYIDEVQVAGMTAPQARKVIQDRLLAIIPSAQVQLSFASGTQNSIQVVSGLPSPGVIALTDNNTTVTSIMAQAGGLPVQMINPQVNLQRNGKLYRIAADRLLNHPELDTTLRGGDKIFIQPDERYFLGLGAAGKEAMINFPRDNITTLDAISLMGGFTSATANPKSVLVMRDYPQSAVSSDPSKGPPKRQMVFAFNLTSADGIFSAGSFLIQDRDLVLVTQSPLVNARTATAFILAFLVAAKAISNNTSGLN